MPIQSESGVPLVSVLMPTFKQAAFIRRAIESLRAQTLTDWELLIVDDGSPDETGELVKVYLPDSRFRYYRLEHNQGLGYALNWATNQARGRYIAYLPSDDVYYPDHLARLIELLDTQPHVYLAYGGVRWRYQHYAPTLQGEAAVGREADTLANPPPLPRDAPLTNDNILALVQVMHRRTLETQVRWRTRDEIVSDRLEPDFWRALIDAEAAFAYTGEISCEWVDHPEQHHKIIAAHIGGLTHYRQHYGISREQWLNFQPSRGMRVNERKRYGAFSTPRQLPTADGLKILLAGSLGFNPERIVALEEHGHKLYGLWLQGVHTWDAAGPLPFGNIDDIPYDDHWVDRVRAVKPDIIYALLNWHVLPLIRSVLDARLDIPLVFHLKEGPFICLEHGQWPLLRRILLESDGQVFISPENVEWFQLTLDGALDPERIMVLDGDLPKLDWMTNDWSSKLSESDGEIHTVCPGRPLGLDPFDAIAEAKIHVHFYGEHFHEWFPTWARKGVATGYMHLHPTVDPDGWVRELSQYDAAWLHVFDSANAGDLRRANWDDLNVPARLGTYAAAGLPWIVKDNHSARVAVQELARRHDVGVFFNDFADLAQQLRDRQRMTQLAANMRAARHQFAFDTHVPALTDFFRKVIAYSKHRKA
jgi:glycosyltransferase involved in cell wall biosynthesis